MRGGGADTDQDERRRRGGIQRGRRGRTCALTLARDWHVRFIELPPLGGGECATLSVSRYVSNIETRRRIETALGSLFELEGARMMAPFTVGHEGGAGTEVISSDDRQGAGVKKGTPVTGSRLIGGLTPCNVIPDEILTDHPKRFRAMRVESGNPAHSVADAARMREALASLELLVVIDVAFTETARLAHYVLPVASQIEKAEATFFNFEFPENYFHVRRPLMAPLPGLFSEAELHCRVL